ncbi:hypothetical protein PC116_g7708 [Phytophthora cactorum]|uniref:Uncharacterized protein n=1 Tax=Phytophthora cactorum TaxID=29920 RepID=A0A8T1L4N3_9STRA|nr:hypothetical protein GQ600_841 [Phytophthora cactorum]KAG2948735.1 hypothetical protein PC117_g5788 [Phytophthora cactorum]KAG3031257.1 hypothetical protein PC120_g3237 [Phytophthora cactorum]KAG3186932.1 hypothetical protein C6341_g3558 [Phytophthora cactorum]KAG3199280.1 hypothetical protein PC128_g5402 [Phytophthora cactorum]
MHEVELHHASTSADPPVIAECDDILEAFLHDMSALDHRELRPTGFTTTTKLSPPASVSPKTRDS